MRPRRFHAECNRRIRLSSLAEVRRSDGWVNVYGAEHKLDLLCSALNEVVRRVQESTDSRFALAAELEPGGTYLLNNAARLGKLFARIDGITGPYGNLRDYVGLNLDVAHMRIANVSANDLRPFNSRVVHSHISDHPGMHTHDQHVGSWTYPHRITDGYGPYIRLMLDREKELAEKRGGKLPFSACLAVELEGANEIFSVHDSLSRLNHIIALAASRYS